MAPRQITHQNIFRVLIAGFALVILLLAAAALVGIRNIGSIQESAASLVREQSVTNRLIGELHRQQTSLSEVFSILAGDPDSVDYPALMNQLQEADRDIDRISQEGASTAESRLWASLQSTSLAFSNEARRILSQDSPESFYSLDLFRDHEAFTSVLARLIEAEYRKVTVAQSAINRNVARMLTVSLLFAAGSILLALTFAVITVRMVSQLIRGMEWQTAELGRVSFHMLENQEAAAQRFSHELHDELGQSLTAIKTNLMALDGTAEHSARLDDCLRLVDEAIGNVREMSQLLRPTILDDFGLEAGIRWLVEGFSARTGIEADFHSSYSGRLHGDTETHLFRIAQEALTNAARHSRAKRVEVRLESEGADICLSIRDNGRGLPAAPVTRSPAPMGMIGMRARARSAGGDMEVKSPPGGGVLIEVRVPIRHETHSHTSG
jgi:signal transduction histidine kinase